MAKKDDVGRWGEEYARQWLHGEGWRILSRNWRCPYGEVDIVAQRARDLVFFEVKTRRSTAFGHPVEAVSAAKLARMRRVAGQWLQDHPGSRGRIRLDVIGILMSGAGVDLEHVEGVG